ncbi:unnamed protein product, partial [Aureobasidium pullulans]
TFGSGKNLRQGTLRFVKVRITSESQSGRDSGEKEQFHHQINSSLVAMVFTPTAPLGRALRRLALTTKQAGKDYYKGTGSGSMGRHTKYGGYRIDWSKVRTYVVPDLSDFALKPFVAENIEKPTKKHEFAGIMSGQKYLDAWKYQGGDI